MYTVGDKFIIEIDSVMTNKKGALYGINGFNSLVFDEKGLDRLEKAENLERLAYDRGYSKAENDYFKQTEVDAENTMQAGYEKGLSDAWECLKKIDELGYDKKMEIFDVSNPIKNLTPQEAIDKLKEWEEKHEIRVGDVVDVDEIGTFVITCIENENLYDCLKLGTLSGYTITDKTVLKKTGNHIDLTEIFKELEGEDEDR